MCGTRMSKPWSYWICLCMGDDPVALSGRNSRIIRVLKGCIVDVSCLGHHWHSLHFTNFECWLIKPGKSVMIKFCWSCYTGQGVFMWNWYSRYENGPVIVSGYGIASKPSWTTLWPVHYEFDSVIYNRWNVSHWGLHEQHDLFFPTCHLSDIQMQLLVNPWGWLVRVEVLLALVVHFSATASIFAMQVDSTLLN